MTAESEARKLRAAIYGDVSNVSWVTLSRLWMSTEKIELDWTVENLADGTWEVWTPDINGACIGRGPNKRSAMEDALDALRNTSERIAFRLHLP